MGGVGDGKLIPDGVIITVSGTPPLFTMPLVAAIGTPPLRTMPLVTANGTLAVRAMPLVTAGASHFLPYP